METAKLMVEIWKKMLEIFDVKDLETKILTRKLEKVLENNN